jgi:DNA-binding XRE family transcriptional regulator
MAERFWREPGGLDLAIARVLPGGAELELRFRFGETYQVAIARLGRGWHGVLAMPSPDARVVQLGLTGGAFVDLPVERVLAACEPAFRRELAARSKESVPVGLRVRELRKLSGKTAMAVAAAAGMARSNYARIEAALHEPKIETLKRVAKALGVPVGAFFERRRSRVRVARATARVTRLASAPPEAGAAAIKR